MVAIRDAWILIQEDKCFMSQHVIPHHLHKNGGLRAWTSRPSRTGTTRGPTEFTGCSCVMVLLLYQGAVSGNQYFESADTFLILIEVTICFSNCTMMFLNKKKTLLQMLERG